MKRIIHIAVTALALSLASHMAVAADLPAGGMTVGEVVKWLQDAGYQARLYPLKNGGNAVASGSDGYTWKIYMFDCNSDGRCGSFQFSMGLSTKGAFNTAKMNDWSRDNRWARAYVDSVNDPWLEYDVDLTPGGTYELLNDEFATWRTSVKHFHELLGV
jgi:hypothetical protein